ncbi:MAG: hypothetical protein J6Y19_08610 [Kiritimatiellae bacterium]|nr:hypothetical protein [Kiritimatiellia bacterium]
MTGREGGGKGGATEDTESTKRVGKEERRGKASGGSTKEQKDKEEGNAEKERKEGGRAGAASFWGGVLGNKKGI